MASTGFIELRSYSLGDLSRWLGDDASKAKDILKRLILAGVARQVKTDKPENWQDAALHGEYISGEIGQETRFAFSFVGVVEIDGHVLKCYPKYIKNRKPKPSDLRLVLQAIERYNAEHTELDTTLEMSSQRMPNKLALALTLIRDYFTYGLYTNQRDELSMHGQGEIDWEVTINTTMPVILDNRPYYFDYYTNDTRQDDTDYITRLHSCIISECSRRLHECELDEILQLETPTPYNGERIDFGTDEFICQRLRKELNVQFGSQKQTLLRNLLAWVQYTTLSNDFSGIRVFGTNSFHALWEAMCADVFESQYTKPIRSLGVELQGVFKDSAETLEDLIEKPQWQATGSKNKLSADKTLRPDYIRIVRNNNHVHFVILDAKYYDIELDDKHVSGQPGVEDVSKQYLYQLAYTDFMHIHCMTPVNAFVSPTDQPESCVAGTAMMPIFSNFQAIKVIKMSANKLFSSYIAHTHLCLLDELHDLFFE